MSSRRRIAYIDHDLNNFHADTYLELARSALRRRGFTIACCTATRAKAGRAWAAKAGVPWVDSVEEMKGGVDYAIVLAPDHPETHLALVREAVKLKVPLYVDKTFAPDHATAKRLFALADRAGVPMISTSALRYTDEVAAALREFGRERVMQVAIWADGGSFANYAIHPLEMAISILGPNVVEARRHRSGTLNRLELVYRDGRLATVFSWPNCRAPYGGILATPKQARCVEVQSPIFRNTLSAIMDFFLSGKEIIDRKETLIIRKILDLCAKPGAASIRS
ncbi:MAG: Gfo/Idh/MocA family oxidoreductase [Verrucomicrobiae bacterium]|nr:Gfo/Idh/MocA family oxidoreductase [Verrucomicrobiae bacterium]